MVDLAAPHPAPDATPPPTPPALPPVSTGAGNPFLPAGGTLPMQPLVKSFPYPDGSPRAE